MHLNTICFLINIVNDFYVPPALQNLLWWWSEVITLQLEAGSVSTHGFALPLFVCAHLKPNKNIICNFGDWYSQHFSKQGLIVCKGVSFIALQTLFILLFVLNDLLLVQVDLPSIQQRSGSKGVKSWVFKQSWAVQCFAAMCIKAVMSKKFFSSVFLRNKSYQRFLLQLGSAFSWIIPSKLVSGCSCFPQGLWEHCCCNWLQNVGQ